MLWLIPKQDYLNDAKTIFYEFGLILSLEMELKIMVLK